MNEPIKLLIVEDESFAALFLKTIFTKYGFHVVKIAATGQEAIQSAFNDSPDVILMDINLIGEMTGIEAADKILSVKKIPIIFATGYDDDDNRTWAGKLNPQGYFVKPITIDMVMEISKIFQESCLTK